MAVKPQKLTRGQLKRLKAKKQGKVPVAEAAPTAPADAAAATAAASLSAEDFARAFAVAPEATSEFQAVFSKFAGEDMEAAVEDGFEKAQVMYSDDEMLSEDEDASVNSEDDGISRKKAKKANRVTVAELKRLVRKPEVVEWTDVSAADPMLLIQIKSTRNAIPVPAHWSQKRDYLQGKRGMEKPAFQLPAFIADTGIASQRDAIKEKEENMSLKQKSRERVQPKMGKIDIDYQKLHDAFFKFQTKPPLSPFGEVYYEGKEFETKLKERKPGVLSDDLKEALSIPPGAPPPWLIAMQKFGPPPSYPNQKIPGLNAPIPEGASWGYHPGGWGQPPLDEYGRPMYGDVYGVKAAPTDEAKGVEIERDLWGEPLPEESESEEEEESEDEDEEDEEEEEAPAPREAPDPFHGTASVASTIPAGVETPDMVNLRKQQIETYESSGPKELFTTLPEKESRIRGLMGSERVYDVGVLGKEEKKRKRNADDVEVSLDAAELEQISEADLEKKYTAAKTASTATTKTDDFSDYISQEVSKRRQNEARKRARQGEKEKFKF